ncbi:sugar kinase [Rhizobium ruizarguesonis]|uniref:2-dehydro-3-deoxygluconokinase n=1 Tax=Rhizobium ruizarguesonis TaxID=2081791 RepID=A0AAE4YSI0_9HYPH|nr:sugar kinase [Rhizobium ruizarguesonis]MBY5880721.1 sugar kinase [Rhizobium leguminosarum]NKL14475.1 sugar kinase [Rhizobium leguminosarum bv. viciae]QIO46869.1 sugar kinase [Rhizobium leguminosarum bv. trifolii]MBY5895518.1 sugar kinase [Rhizobium leguminosarum]MCB2399803.1 sugar kinase [Rhizobium ruizarguesonis]
MSRRFLSIGECMVELSQAGDGLLRKGFAGDTFNTAWYARACLAADWSVEYFTALGDDAMSDEMLAFIDTSGIGTSLIRRIKGRTPGLYMINLKNGERSFSYWRDSSAARSLAADPDSLREAVESAAVIYFSGITLAILPHEDAETLLAEVRRAKAAGKLVVFDPNIRPRLWSSYDVMHTTISEGARSSVVVMPSFDDEAAHFGDDSIEATIHRYRALGAVDIVVKNGADGVTLNFAGEQTFVPAEKVKKVVDTTSAGDSFNGAFLARYLEAGDAPAAARFAAKVAARVVSEHGALVVKEKLGLDGG